MPYYKYKCEDNHITIESRKMDDRNEPATCEECGKPAEKTLSTANTIIPRHMQATPRKQK